jgi:hypothetical protein
MNVWLANFVLVMERGNDNSDALEALSYLLLRSDIVQYYPIYKGRMY